jgi:hypothetical protein
MSAVIGEPAPLALERGLPKPKNYLFPTIWYLSLVCF